MELKHYRLIKTIVEEGTITNSSEKLFLTPSALSHQLREIETLLGVKVFIRFRNDWKLTKEGKELYALAIELFNRIDESFVTIKHLQEGTQGKVRVSTACYSFYQGLPAFIQQMDILYPQIQVELNLEATHHPIDKLLSNDIDIALTTTLPTHQNLEYIPIAEDELFAVMHQEHSLATQDFITAEDFSQLHLIIHSFPLDSVSVYELFLRPKRIMPLKITAIALTEVSLEMVLANMGIMCMPKWALKAFKVSDSICFKPLGQEGIKRTHYLVCRKEDKAKKYIFDFIENFKESYTSR